MSAGFKFDNDVHWGSNGAIEVCVEALYEQASVHLDADDAITQFLREQNEILQTGIMGWIVFLDDILTDFDSRHRFLQLWDAAATQIKGSDNLTEHGFEWLEYTTENLKAAMLDVDNPS